MFSDKQQEIYNASKDFVIDKLDTLLSKSPSDSAKKSLFFLLGIALIESNKATVNIAKTFYPESKYKPIRDFFTELNQLVNGDDPLHEFVCLIADPNLITIENNNDVYKAKLNEHFAKHLKNDLKIWLDDQAKAGLFHKDDFNSLHVYYNDLINEDDAF